MENYHCPECQGELKPIYRNVYSKDKVGYRAIDGAILKPSEWLCESCRKIFEIREVGILC